MPNRLLTSEEVNALFRDVGLAAAEAAVPDHVRAALRPLLAPACPDADVLLVRAAANAPAWPVYARGRPVADV